MSLTQLKQATQELSSLELQEFARWVAEFEANDWDKQLEHDLQAGHLDALIAEAELEYTAGLARKL